MTSTLIEARSVGVHDGTFHADEVTAVALLMLFDLVDRRRVIRSRNLDKLGACEFVCDVGGVYDASIKRFDHHQSEYTGEFSSAGMVLAFLRDKKLIDETLYAHFNDMLITGVDAHDNGRVELRRGECSFSGVISNFMPIEYGADAHTLNDAFFQAVDFAFGHLERMLKRFEYTVSCCEKVQRAMNEGRELLLFEEAMPWLDNFFNLGGVSHPAKFLIMPAGEHWKLRGIPPNANQRMKVRIAHPKAWAGLLEGELASASGIEGGVFCHKGGFISVWESKESAVKAFDKIMKEQT